jgi:hypothetical protein
MFKLISILIKLLESKLLKTGIEQAILKNQNYIVLGKQIWNIVDEHFRITDNIAEKIKSKSEMFDSLILQKFPELSQSDIDLIRQSIAGEVNQGKQAVIDNSQIIQQLQQTNATLQAENTSLKSNIDTLVNTVNQYKNQ